MFKKHYEAKRAAAQQSEIESKRALEDLRETPFYKLTNALSQLEAVDEDQMISELSPERISAAIELYKQALVCLQSHAETTGELPTSWEAAGLQEVAAAQILPIIRKSDDSWSVEIMQVETPHDFYAAATYEEMSTTEAAGRLWRERLQAQK